VVVFTVGQDVAPDATVMRLATKVHGDAVVHPDHEPDAGGVVHVRDTLKLVGGTCV
jgi:hypothetical protein